MYKMIKKIFIFLVCFSIFSNFLFSNKADAITKTKYVTSGKAPTYEKKIKLYDGRYIKTDIPLTSRLTSNKSVQNQFKNEALAQIKEHAPYGDNKSSKIKVEYYIKSNVNSVLSIRAKLYSLKSGKSKYINSVNFNYYTKFDNINNCILYIETVSKNIDKTDKYLRKMNKKKGYGNIGLDPNSPFFEYYFDRKGNAVFTYSGREINKNNNKTYTTIIPSKYFTYDLVLNKN